MSDELEAKWLERMKSEHPELATTAEQNRKHSQELHAQANTTEMVRVAQDKFIERCDLDVADDYAYPTPEELGITVDEDYAALHGESDT